VAHSTTFEALDPAFHGLLRHNHRTWSLCIGAGVTFGTFPSWKDLARQVLNRALGISLGDTEFIASVAQTGWQFDAWIQTAFNAVRRAGSDEATFAALVEDVVYADLRHRARSAHIDAVLNTALHHVDLLTLLECQSVLNFLEKVCANTTLRILADVLTDAVDAGYAPKSILTFNYDTLLETLFRLRQLSAVKGTNQYPPAVWRRIDGPAPPTAENKIPIFSSAWMSYSGSGARTL
jgi:hypothetical protein